MGVAAAGGQTSREIVLSPPLTIVPGEQTLKERVAVLDTALLVRVVSSPQSHAVDISGEVQRSNPDVLLQGPILMTVTESDVAVLEAFKAPADIVAGSALRISTIGGRGEWNGQPVVMRRRAADLRAGGTYFVMARRERAWNDAFMFEDYDVFQIEDGKVTADPLAPKARYGNEIVGGGEADVVERFRRASAF